MLSEMYAYEPVAAVLRSAEGEALGGVTLVPLGAPTPPAPGLAPEEPVAYATVGKAKAGSGAAARLLRSLIRVSPSWLSRWVGARSTGSRLDRHPVFPCPNGELPNGTS